LEYWFPEPSIVEHLRGEWSGKKGKWLKNLMHVFYLMYWIHDKKKGGRPGISNSHWLRWDPRSLSEHGDLEEGRSTLAEWTNIYVEGKPMRNWLTIHKSFKARSGKWTS
jgi:hypothetical protein